VLQAAPRENEFGPCLEHWESLTDTQNCPAFSAKGSSAGVTYATCMQHEAVVQLMGYVKGKARKALMRSDPSHGIAQKCRQSIAYLCAESAVRTGVSDTLATSCIDSMVHVAEVPTAIGAQQACPVQLLGLEPVPDHFEMSHIKALRGRAREILFAYDGHAPDSFKGKNAQWAAAVAACWETFYFGGSNKGVVRHSSSDLYELPNNSTQAQLAEASLLEETPLNGPNTHSLTVQVPNNAGWPAQLVQPSSPNSIMATYRQMG